MTEHVNRRRRLAALGLALLLATAAVGCGSSSDHSASDSASDSASSGGDRSVAADDLAAGGQSAEAPASGVDPAVAAASEQRQVISTAQLVVTVAHLDRAVEQAERITDAAGGLVFDESTTRADDPRTVLTVKVPPDAFEQVRHDLAGLGELESTDKQTEDVTAQVVDLDSRIATSEASVDRLRALIVRAENIDDITVLESQLLERETTLESLRGERRTIQDQIDLATITVTLQPTPNSADVPANEDDELPGFLDALHGGFDALLKAGSVLLIVLFALLPWVPVVLVVALAVHFGRRWYRRRHPTPPTVPYPVAPGAGPLPPRPPPAAPMPTTPPGEGQSLS